MKTWHATMGVALGIAVSTSPAADKPNTVTSEDMVVTASRDERRASDTPAHVTVLTSDDLQRGAYASVPDALQSLGGIYVRSITGNPATMEVGMRGFGENSHGRVLVLLDGQRLNRPDMASINWLQIPLNNIERIEVVRGSGSVLYGDHAVGGVINIITRKGKQEPILSLRADGGSFGMNALRAGSGQTADDFAYSVNAERYETDGYRERTGFRSWGLGASGAYNALPVKLSLAFSCQEDSYEIPGWLTKQQMDADPKRSTNPNDSSDNRHVTGHATLAMAPRPGHKIDVGIFLGQKDIKSDMASWMSWSDLTIDSLGVTPRYVMDGSMFGRNNNLVAGVDWCRDSLDVERFPDAERSFVTVSADVSRDTLGFYVRDELHLTDSLVLGAGGRIESARIAADVADVAAGITDDSRTHRVQAYDASLIRTFANQSKTFVRLGSVYRYPFVDEQVSYAGFGIDNFNADLDPEKGWNAEAGAEVRLTDEWTAGAALFWMEMNDEIAWDFTAMRNSNLDETRRQGSELSVAYTPASFFRVSANYTCTWAVFTEGANDGNHVPLVPLHKAGLSGDVSLPKDLRLGTAVRYVGEAYLGGDNGNIKNPLHDYVVVDMQLQYAPDYLPGFTAFLAADNLFNEKYADLGYVGFIDDGYYPAPGAGFRGGVSYRF